MPTCPECGASFAADDDSCELRFQHLLALDHSRQAPWGPLHGLAFAAFALQHPGRYDDAVLERAWMLVQRVVRGGEDAFRVAQDMRLRPPDARAWEGAPFPGRSAPRRPFGVTIATLGEFPADRYSEQALTWGAAAIEGWGP